MGNRPQGSVIEMGYTPKRALTYYLVSIVLLISDRLPLCQQFFTRTPPSSHYGVGGFHDGSGWVGVSMSLVVSTWYRVVRYFSLPLPHILYNSLAQFHTTIFPNDIILLVQ